MQSLMRHTADVWRAALTQAAGQEIGGYAEVYTAVPCFAQPATASQIISYQQRGQEVTHIVYTTAVDKTFTRNDILVVNGRQLHVEAVKEALLSGIYLELACFEYPEGAKKRLDRESY
jgi:hypothetical protein